MKDKLLSILKENDNYISGEVISNQLGVSRAAVWKAIKKLQEQGYIIESKTKKGYKLIGIPDILYSWELTNLLNTKVIGNKIYHLNNAASTNDTAHKMAMENQSQGLIVISEHQTDGRGHKNTHWLSPEGKGIYLSVVLSPNTPYNKLPQMSILVTTSVCKALSEILCLEIQCTYSGDVIYQNKKLCGVLIEFSGALDNIRYVISGIGVNVNIVQHELYEMGISDSATSLQIISKHKQDRKQVAATILNKLDEYYSMYINDEYYKIMDEYRKICTTIGQYITISANKTAKCIDITENNQLVLQNEDGSTFIL